MKTLEYQDSLTELEESVENFKVTVLLGPDGVGKSRAASLLEVPEGNRFDMEDPLDQASLEEAEEVLGELSGLVVIDGLHRQPDLFPILLDLATGWGGPSRFLATGMTSPDMMSGVAESATAKVNFIEARGVSSQSQEFEARDLLWLRGGFPESYFAEDDGGSGRWRRRYVEAHLRRSLPSIGVDVPPERMRRFWKEAANAHGQTWNSSSIAGSMGISHPTARSYLDLLTGTFMLRQLRPFMTGGKKRMVKAPKVYVRDSGLLHELLGIESMDALESSPVHAASWEGFALEQLVSALNLKSDELFFWATHGGAELDLVIEREGKRFGFEFSLNENPGVSHSMTIAKADLELDVVYLVHPGSRSFPLREGMEALGFAGLPQFELP